jgi:hypothetical protein
MRKDDGRVKILDFVSGQRAFHNDTALDAMTAIHRRAGLLELDDRLEEVGASISALCTTSLRRP